MRFFATSLNQDKTWQFMYWARDTSKLPAVKWVVQMDTRGAQDFRYRCKHVNLVVKRAPGLGDEEEYLFVPYSAFTIERVEVSDVADEDDPHIIHLTATVDNKRVPDSLPLAPWS